MTDQSLASTSRVMPRQMPGPSRPLPNGAALFWTALLGSVVWVLVIAAVLS